MEAERPYLLTIAGFDPSAGAGVLADIKTFEVNKVYGQAVITSVTFQNEKDFESVKWISLDEILKQLEILHKAHSFHWVKIGLIESLEILEAIIDYLISRNAEIKIIWDPILKASAGFQFHESIERERLERICSKIFLLTPNRPEMEKLFPERSATEGAQALSKITNVLLKGGHAESEIAKDILFENGNEYSLTSQRIEYDKHGTGCVLSAAILTNLSKEYELSDACREAKHYVTDFIKSSKSLLGFHYV